MEHVLKFRVGRVVAGVMAVVAAALMATAGNAAAEEPPGGIVWDHTYEAPGVRVYVEEHGDIISVCDTKANGHSARIEVGKDDWPLAYEMAARGGAGTCETHRASDGWRYNLMERVNIQLAFDGNGGNDTWKLFYNDH
jgi:hypothetical protein